MVDRRGTLTPPEHDLIVFLEAGPAVLGPRTEQFTLRTGSRAGTVVRTVDTKLARRLARAGLTTIDPGGTVTLVEAAR